MTTNSSIFSNESTQQEPLVGSNQQANTGGGYSFVLTPWQQFERFLVLGTEGGTFYVKEQALSKENANNALVCLKEDGKKFVDMVEAYSVSGRTPKVKPILFALALAVSFGDAKTKAYGLSKLGTIARTSSHLMSFLAVVTTMRKWGSALPRAIREWYNAKKIGALSYQMLKYRQRDGWTQRDILRTAHVKPASLEHDALYHYLIQTQSKDARPLDESKISHAPQLLKDFMVLKEATAAETVVEVIGNNTSVTWEMIPTEYLKDARVWEALLLQLPVRAMVTNLGRLTALGVLKPMSTHVDHVVSVLTNEKMIKKSRLHPLAILNAKLTYESGHAVRGSLCWDPVARVSDALEKAFYLAFANVEPTGKRMMLALDVSGSMTSRLQGNPLLSCRDATAALALVTARTEEKYEIMAFSSGFIPLNISATDSLASANRKVSCLDFDWTDCALPMRHARKHKIPVDCFVIYTDCDTNAREGHPSTELMKYREEMGIPAKLVVVGMTATQFSIADPRDRGMLDVVGFDTSVPELIANFMKE